MIIDLTWLLVGCYSHNMTGESVLEQQNDSQKLKNFFYFILLLLILVILGEGIYLSKLVKDKDKEVRTSLEETSSVSPTPPLSGYLTIERSDQGNYYFHEIDPIRLPYYEKFKQFYDSFYTTNKEFLLNKKVNNNFFVNGHGYYYYQSIPVKLFGIYEGYYFENDKHYVLVGVLSKDNQYKYFQVNLLSPQETAIKIWDLSGEQTIHDIYLADNQEQKYTLDKELVRPKFLEKGTPICVFIETEMPNVATVVVVFTTDKLDNEKFKSLRFN